MSSRVQTKWICRQLSLDFSIRLRYRYIEHTRKVDQPGRPDYSKDFGTGTLNILERIDQPGRPDHDDDDDNDDDRAVET
jgi:hypothetical protein